LEDNQSIKMPGILITFEGIDLCGKSAQMERLVDRLKTHHFPHLLLREPGGTIFSEKIRDILLTKEKEDMCAATEYLLFSAARAQMTRQKIIPALADGFIVVCDRYFDSSTAYQGYGRGIDLSLIERINHFASSGIKPDVTFLLDIDLEEMEKRKSQMSKKTDRMEDQAKDFFLKVRKGYLSLANQNQERFILIDGKKTIISIAEQVWKKVERVIAQKYQAHNQ